MRYISYGSFEDFTITDDSLSLTDIRNTISDFFPELKLAEVRQVGNVIQFYARGTAPAWPEPKKRILETSSYGVARYEEPHTEHKKAIKIPTTTSRLGIYKVSFRGRVREGEIEYVCN
jgi:hypothetical protein